MADFEARDRAFARAETRAIGPVCGVSAQHSPSPDPSPSMEMGEGVSGGCPRVWLVCSSDCGEWTIESAWTDKLDAYREAMRVRFRTCEEHRDLWRGAPRWQRAEHLAHPMWSVWVKPLDVRRPAEEDRDPWLDEPWTAEEEAAFAAVSEDDEEW